MRRECEEGHALFSGRRTWMLWMLHAEYLRKGVGCFALNERAQVQDEA